MDDAQKWFCVDVDIDVALAEGFDALMMWEAIHEPILNCQSLVV